MGFRGRQKLKFPQQAQHFTEDFWHAKHNILPKTSGMPSQTNLSNSKLLKIAEEIGYSVSTQMKPFSST